MAINETVQTLLLMKADVSDLRAKLRTVAADEKAVVKAQIEAAEARNKSITKWTDGLAKVSSAIGIATKAIDFAGESFKAFEEHQRLSAASSKYNLDALRKSSAGLKTDLDLMRIAQKAAGAQHSISQLQLENATKAMRAFEAAGFEGAKVQEKVGEALLKGSIEPLKDLGVNLEAAKGKTAQMAQLMEVLGQKSKQAGAGVNAQTDEFKKAGVEYQNAMRKLQVSIGEIVVALAPLIGALAKVVGLVADIVNEVKGGTLGSAPLHSIAGAAGGQYGYGFGDGINNQFAGAANVQNKLSGLEGIRASQANAIVQSTMGIANAGFTPPKPKSKGGGRGKDKSPIGYVELENTGEVVPIWGYDQALGQTLGSSGGPTNAMLGAANTRAGVYNDQESERIAAMIADLDKFTADGISGENETMLAKLFGPLEEFDAYAAAFDTLAVSVQAGFDAWVSGSASATQAIKKAFAGSISAMASELFAKSIAWGATGIAEMFMPGMQAQGIAHLKGAAGLAAAAVTVGGIARQLGGGGAGAGASAGVGGGRAPSVTGGSGGGNSGVTNYNITVGDVWAPDNQRKKDRDVARAIRSAERELQGGTGVVRR